jgi:hypothetical protein
MHRHTATVTLIVTAGLAVVSIAQPEPRVSPTPSVKTPPSIPDALSALRAAYRTGPLADRVTIKATDASGKERRVQVMVYTDPGEAPKPEAETKPGDAPMPEPKPDASRPPQCRVDLGQLHVFMQSGTLTAINLFDRTTFFRVSCDASPLAALSANFPPIPLPQIPLAFSDDGAFAEPTPLTPGVTWTSIEPATETGRMLLILKGHSSGGHAVTLAYERATTRLRRFTIEFAAGTTSAPDALVKLDLTSSPGDAGNAKNWSLPITNRTRVDSPASLVPPRSGLAEGSTIKHASLMTRDLAPVAPEDLFTKSPAGGGPRVAILVTVRGESLAPGAELAGGADLAAALAAADAASKSSPVPTRVGLVALLGKGESDPEVIAALGQRAAKAAADAGIADPDAVFFTASEVLGIQRGGEPVAVALLAVAPDLKVLGVAVADQRGSETKPLAEEIVRAIAKAEAGKKVDESKK